MGLLIPVRSSAPVSQPQITDNPRVKTHKKIAAFHDQWLKKANDLPSNEQEGFRNMVDDFAKQLWEHCSELSTLKSDGDLILEEIDQLIGTFNCRLETHYLYVKKFKEEIKQVETIDTDLERDLRKPFSFPFANKRPATNRAPLNSRIVSQGPFPAVKIASLAEKQFVEAKKDWEKYAARLPEDEKTMFLNKIDFMRDEYIEATSEHIRNKTDPKVAESQLKTTLKELDLKLKTGATDHRKFIDQTIKNIDDELKRAYPLSPEKE